VLKFTIEHLVLRDTVSILTIELTMSVSTVELTNGVSNQFHRDAHGGIQLGLHGYHDVHI